MVLQGARERKLGERVCCEQGCDRPAAYGDVRCELHVLRLGGTLLPKPGPQEPAVVDAPVLDAIAPMRAIEVLKEHRRAGPRLAAAAVCQVLGLVCIAALLETFRFLDLTLFESLPNLALFEVPYSDALNLYLPGAGWVLLSAAQLRLAWVARRSARSPGGRWTGTALLFAGAATAVAVLAIVGEAASVLGHLPG